ncbi:MAG: MFS transporter [Saprospiraceae bacterium]|nr:MFS transporter [Saprospiraceae bacterium]
MGFSIGPAVGGLIAGWFGFKWIFLFDAVTCLLAAIILMVYLPFQKQPVSDKDKISIPKSKSAYQDKTYLIFIFLVSMYAIAFFQLFTSVPVYWAKEWGIVRKNWLPICTKWFDHCDGELPFIRATEHYSAPGFLYPWVCILVVQFFTIILGGLVFIPPSYLLVFMSFLRDALPAFAINYAVSRPADDRRGQYMALYAMAYGGTYIAPPSKRI